MRGDPTRPARCALQHQEAIEALEFRVSGLRGLADGVPAGVAVAEERDRQRAQAARSLRPTGWSRATCLGRPVPGARAGERRRAPARGDHRRRRPGSRFVTSPDYASTRYWEAILQRLQGAATSGGGGSGGLHGTGLVPTG